jgi:hypothetical protein
LVSEEQRVAGMLRRTVFSMVLTLFPVFNVGVFFRPPRKATTTFLSVVDHYVL